MSRLDRPAVQRGLAVLSGLISALAFPSWDMGWLAFVGWVPLCFVVQGVRPRRAAGLGFFAGFAFYLATVWWVINTMTTYGHMPLVMSILALVLMAAVLAGYVAAFGALLASVQMTLRISAGLVPALAAMFWTGIELVRTYLFSGFPWALLGYTQYRQPTLRLLASVVGVYGISALIMLVNATLAGFLAAWQAASAARRWRDQTLAVGIAVLALAASAAYANGVWRDETAGPAIAIGLLQGNIDQSIKWDRRYQLSTLEIYERLAREAATQHPMLIVWPEAATPFLLRREPEMGARIVQLVKETGVPMLIGTPDIRADGLFYNSAFLLDTEGRLAGRYDKRHLVPFGEYVPLQSLLFFVHRLAVGIGDFGRGVQATVLSTDGFRFGVMICYEAIFPAEVREFAVNGAQVLVNITNDAWFGRSSAPYQHFAMAVMRAVENGMYLVRAANTGISAVVDPAGTVHAQTPLFTQAVLVGTVHRRVGETLYTRYGDWFAWLCLAGSVGYGLALSRQWWSRRKEARV
ncbi:MAG TPA: apolipoprotein N-acyltransferase [Candidatus Baltobacteraceae bacterium]|nr:apolipoprotein N-acyltransferase [Candidatus Baltobacteraceae bacterium]